MITGRFGMDMAGSKIFSHPLTSSYSTLKSFGIIINQNLFSISFFCSLFRHILYFCCLICADYSICIVVS